MMKRAWPRLAFAVGLSFLAAPSFSDLVTPDVMWRQGTNGLAEISETSDRFGSALASGDFNGDSYMDLAIGVRGENSLAGAVHVIFGSPSGLGVVPLQLLINQSLLIAAGGEGSEPGDQFGHALAVGRFNNDDLDDLAIGAPYEDVGAVDAAGAVSVIYGDAILGLNLATADYWTQSNSGFVSNTSDWFGFALAAADFDGNSFDDLAIGLPGQDVTPGAGLQHGMIQILYSNSTGLSAANSTAFSQTHFPTAGDPEDGEKLGSSLAAGYLDGDGFADLAIGVPYDEFRVGQSDQRCGSVIVMFGSNGGLTTTGSQHWHQGLSAVPGNLAANDDFGFALAIGSFDGDSYDDLAIGVPGEPSSTGLVQAGAVLVLYGTSSKASFGAAKEMLTQGADGIQDVPEINDRFGSALAASRYEGIGDLDFLLVAAPGESVGTVAQAGTVHFLQASLTGLRAATSKQAFTQNTDGVGDVSEIGDRFGEALAVGDFNGDGLFDAAIGVPGEGFTGPTVANAGLVHVLSHRSNSLLFAHDFECGCYGGFVPTEDALTSRQ